MASLSILSFSPSPDISTYRHPPLPSRISCSVSEFPPKSKKSKKIVKRIKFSKKK